MENMNCYTWEFEYPAADVLKGAKANLVFAKTRLAFWEKKRNEVKKKVKAEGVDFDETQFNVRSNYDHPTTVKIKSTLIGDLRECDSHIQVRKSDIESYTAWILVLKSHTKEALKLTYSDWRYFFEHNPPAPEAKARVKTTTLKKPGAKPAIVKNINKALKDVKKNSPVLSVVTQAKSV